MMGDSAEPTFVNLNVLIQAAMLFAADMAEDRFLPLEQEAG